MSKTSVEKMDTKANDENSDAYRMYAAFSFIIVIILIGVPMWWKTTEVYRVTLPNDGIENLNHNPIIITATYSIFTNNPERSKILINELNQIFNHHEFLNLQFIQIQLNEHVVRNTKTPAELELILLKQNKINAGDFIFIEWHKQIEDILVTSDRTAFISTDVSSMKIQNVIKTWLLEEHNLRSILGNLTTSQGFVSRHKSAPPQPHYDVLISVLNPRPDLQKVHWNVRSDAEKFVTPFLEVISPLSNFTLKSQWKYQVQFEVPNKQIRDDTKLGRHYVLPQENLPHIITSVERKLGNEISNSPCIHLVVYIPPCQTAPLYIFGKNGKKASKSNVDSFLSAKWGGILIVNPPESACLEYMEKGTKIDFNINSQDVMQVMLFLLRKIVGIQNDVIINGASMTSLENIEARMWEVDTHIRIGVVHLLTSATLTLKSLVKLLGDISYIVINDEVGEGINYAFQNIVLAKKLLQNGDIYNAVIYAKEAFRFSETAFFDPSLLALLYFPDEQKYAIYIPLFLPIMIPVLLSLTSIKNYICSNKDKRNENDNIEENFTVDDENYTKLNK